LRKATLEEVEWLKNRRQKAVVNRERLVGIADRRFESMPYDLVDQLQLKFVHKDLHSSYSKVSVIPLYPSRPLLQYLELLDLRDIFNNSLDQVLVLDSPISATGSLCFPYVRKSEGKTPDWFNYTEFNIFGLVYNKQSLLENANPETKELFDVSYFLKQIYRVVTVGKATYEKIGYYGNALIDVQVGGILGKKIGAIENRRASYGWFSNIIETDIHIEKVCSFGDLNENLDSLIINLCKEFLWCCGGGDKIKDDPLIMSTVKNLYDGIKK
jgi:hypothetical protein